MRSVRFLPGRSSFFYFQKGGNKTKSTDCIKYQTDSKRRRFPPPTPPPHSSSKPTASKRRQQVQVNVTPVCRVYWRTKSAGSCQKPIGTDVCRSCPLGPFRLGHSELMLCVNCTCGFSLLAPREGWKLVARGFATVLTFFFFFVA